MWQRAKSKMVCAKSTRFAPEAAACGNQLGRPAPSVCNPRPSLLLDWRSCPGSLGSATSLRRRQFGGVETPFAVALVRSAFPVLSKAQRKRFGLPLNVFRFGYYLVGDGPEYVAIPDAIESHDRVSGLAALRHRSRLAIGCQIDCQRSPGPAVLALRANCAFINRSSFYNRRGLGRQIGNVSFPVSDTFISRALAVIGKTKRERFRLPLNSLRCGNDLVSYGMQRGSIPHAGKLDHHIATVATLCHGAGLEIGSNRDHERHTRGVVFLHVDRAFVNSICNDFRPCRHCRRFRHGFAEL